MPRWLKRVRGAIGMGVTWAIGWAVGGLMVGVLSILTPSRVWDVFFEFFDAPLPALAIPGFLGGALFSIVMTIAARHQRFDELSLARVTTWGAIGGVLLGIVPFVFGSAARGSSPVLLGVVVVSICTALSAVSAAASLLMARRATRPDPLAVSARDRLSMTEGDVGFSESLLDQRVNSQPVGEQSRPL